MECDSAFSCQRLAKEIQGYNRSQGTMLQRNRREIQTE